MVGALTEDPAIRHYAQRKRDLRARSVAAGSPVVDVAVADKIASLRDALLTGTPLSATASCATTRSCSSSRSPRAWRRTCASSSTS